MSGTGFSFYGDVQWRQDCLAPLLSLNSCNSMNNPESIQRQTRSSTTSTGEFSYYGEISWQKDCFAPLPAPEAITRAPIGSLPTNHGVSSLEGGAGDVSAEASNYSDARSQGCLRTDVMEKPVDILPCTASPPQAAALPTTPGLDQGLSRSSTEAIAGEASGADTLSRTASPAIAVSPLHPLHAALGARVAEASKKRPNASRMSGDAISKERPAFRRQPDEPQPPQDSLERQQQEHYLRQVQAQQLQQQQLLFMQQHFFDQQQQQQQLQNQWWQQQQYMQQQSLQAFNQQQQQLLQQQQQQRQQRESIPGNSGNRIQPPPLFPAPSAPPPLDAPPPLAGATSAWSPSSSCTPPVYTPTSPAAAAAAASSSPVAWRPTWAMVPPPDGSNLPTTGMNLSSDDDRATTATGSTAAAGSAAVPASIASAASGRWEARQCVGSFCNGSLDQGGSSIGFSPNSSCDPGDWTHHAATVSLSGASNGSSFADAPLQQPSSEEAFSGPLERLQPGCVNGNFHNCEIKFSERSTTKDQISEQEQKHRQLREQQPHPLLQEMC